MMQTVHTSSHNGITSLWLDRDGLCTGTLIFGVGMRDEPSALAGITHLVEHVLLRLVQPAAVVHGGTVTTDSLQFYAVGKPEDVAGFLNAIAVAVSTFEAVTDEVIALEKSVLEAEDPHKFSTVSSGFQHCLQRLIDLPVRNERRGRRTFRGTGHDRSDQS
ncbi:hypothetical protein [Arthrobacter sp. NPDC056727]|uniref:hypothetical protein n=1 Tax=Arthrobacter sp. NPDC056727 TaxID=3345927 RepID=UPI00366E0E53